MTEPVLRRLAMFIMGEKRREKKLSEKHYQEIIPNHITIPEA